MKRNVFIVLLLISAVALFARGQNEASGEMEGQVQDTLNIAIKTDRGTMAPVWASQYQGYCVFETLYKLNAETNEFIPLIAESLDFVDDVTLVAKIREGITDSAGNPFTASDVVYSYKWGLGDFVTAMGIYAIDFDKTRAIDDYTVEIVLKAPNVSQWYLLEQQRLFTQAAMEASENGMKADPVGTGQYVLTEYIQGSRVSFTRNENYWGTPAAIKNVNWLIIPETSQRMMTLESGEVDFSEDIAGIDYKRMEKNDKIDADIVPSFASTCIYFNCSEYSICNDPAVRQAVSYAVSKDAVNKIVYSDLFVPSVIPGSRALMGIDLSWNAKDGYYDLDPAKAKSLLAKAGIAEGTEVVIGIPGENAMIATAEVIQGALIGLGLDAKIQSYEPAVWNEVQIDPQSGIDLAIHTPGCPDGYFGNKLQANFRLSQTIFYDNDELLDMIDESLMTMDKDAQLVINKKLNDLVVKDVPILSLVDNGYIYAWDSNVKGVKKMHAERGRQLDLSYLSY